MAGVARRDPPLMSIELFRAFYATRPDEEQWQLIDGVAVDDDPTDGGAPADRRPTFSVSSDQALSASRANAHRLPAARASTSRPSIEHYDPEPDVVGH